MPPANSENSQLGIEAKYKDLDQWFSTIPSAISQSKNYIQATLKTQYPEVNFVPESRAEIHQALLSQFSLPVGLLI